MAYNKIEVFSKIGDLLVEINDGYAALAVEELGQKSTDLLLLEAKARYLTTHLEVLQRLTAQDKPQQVEESSSVSNTVTSTIELPAVVLAEQHETQPAPEPVVVANPIAHVAPDFFTPEEIEEVAAAPQPEVQKVDVEAPYVAPPVAEPTYTTPVERPAEEPVVVQKTVVEEAKEVVVETPAAVVEETVVEAVAAPSVEEPVAEVKEAPARPLTLNEILQQQKAQATAAHSAAANTERVVDLRHAISLNDKLLFIKDLFNGYSLAYSEAIELLNRYGTFAEADTFLQTNYALKNNWTDKPQTVEKLYAILRKKYM